MLHHASSILWGLRQRHRRGLLVLLAGAVVMALVVQVLRLAGLFDDVSPAHGVSDLGITVGVWGGIVPGLFAGCYLLAVFAYGFETDLAATDSCYPTHALTLPVRSVELVGWPMLFVATGLGLLWLALVFGVLRPCGLQASAWWPALFVMVLATWLQALAWSAFALPFQRIVVSVVVLLTPILLVIYALQVWQWTEASVCVLLAGLLPLGFLGGWRGLARARRGDVPRWDGLRSFGRRLVSWRWRRRAFASAAGAQVWFEWRRHGLQMPVMVALIFPCLLAPLLLGTNDVIPTGRTLVLALLLPLLLSGTAAATVGKHNNFVRDYYGVPAFTATRPMTTAALVAAKYKMALVSTSIAWGFLIVTTTAAIAATEARHEVLAWGEQFIEQQGVAKLIALVLLVPGVLFLLTWKKFIENQVIGLTGREWFIKGSMIAGFGMLLVVGILGSWLWSHPEHHETARAIAPWALGAIVLFKLTLAAWILKRLHAWRLVPSAALIGIGAGWLGAASLLFGVARWLLPSEWLSWQYLAAVVVLTLPLVRPALGPLALAYNRHR